MFEVWTATYDPELKEETVRLELTRSEREVAQNDAYLFRTILNKRAWVEEKSRGQVRSEDSARDRPRKRRAA